jgi:hypothetical protein
MIQQFRQFSERHSDGNMPFKKLEDRGTPLKIAVLGIVGDPNPELRRLFCRHFKLTDGPIKSRFAYIPLRDRQKRLGLCNIVCLGTLT